MVVLSPSTMLCLRRTAVRVLSPQTSSRYIKPRSITTLTQKPLLRSKQVPLVLIQRRFASEETQSEPVADGAIETQHGDNSIAATSPDASETSKTNDDHVEAEPARGQQPVPEASEEQSTVASAVSSVSESVINKASELGSGVAAITTGFSRLGGSAFPTKPDASNTLYLGNLFFDVSEADLTREMSKFGDLKSIKIIRDGKGLSKGFGYAEFEDVKAATKALEALDNAVFEGRRMTVQYSVRKDRRGATPHPPAKTLFIGNMAYEMTDQDLNDLFKEVRNVIDVRVAIDRRTGQPRGFAHADFIDVPSAEKAKAQLEGRTVYGRSLRIDFTVPSKPRDGRD